MSEMNENPTHYRCFIDGRWVDSSSRIEVENKATGRVFATVPACGTESALEALEAADRARHAWSDLPPVERANHLYRMTAALAAEREHFARLLVMEQGKTLNEALAEVDDTIRYINYSAEATRRIVGEIMPSDAPNEDLYIHRVPHGVTVGLCAFNYPLALIGRKIGPALATGNTMVLKPHDLTPVTACEFGRIVEQSGLPKGVLSIITGTTADVGIPLVESGHTRLITVTGSIPAGRAIYAAAAKNITVLSLELGGKAPFIVLEDADIDRAVEAAAIARYANCGQVCICNEGVLVHEKVAAEFSEKLLMRVQQIKVGDPMLNIGMGCATSKPGLERVFDIVKKTVAEGATLALGGARPDGAAFERGNWMQPTVLLDTRPGMTAVEEEIFGPVLPVTTISGYEEALALTNARTDGLSAYLWTNDHRRMRHAIRNMDTGTIFINKGICGYIQGYHSGHKHSGLAGEDGIHGMEVYLQKRTVYMSWD